QTPPRSPYRREPVDGLGAQRLRAEYEAVGASVDLDRVALLELAREELHGQGVLDLALDEALQGPRAVRRVVALVGQVLAGFRGQRDRELSVRHALLQQPDLEVDDLSDVLLVQGADHEYLVAPVEELGPEVSPHLGQDLLPLLVGR